MSILYRKRDGITLAQLVRGWASELPGDPKQVEDELLRFLLEDAASGRLDKAGPLVGNDPAGCRYGLRWPGYQGRYQAASGFLPGRLLEKHVGPQGETSKGSPIPRLVVILKEAALDFARRHELPPPSWWADVVPESLSRHLQSGEQNTNVQPRELRLAPHVNIHEAIKAAYDAADAAGRKPPNIKELPAAVLPRLEEKGYRATERSIQKVGEAQEFKRRRRRPGKTISSERRAQRK